MLPKLCLQEPKTHIMTSYRQTPLEADMHHVFIMYLFKYVYVCIYVISVLMALGVVWGVGCGSWGVWFGVWGLRCLVWGVECGV